MALNGTDTMMDKKAILETGMLERYLLGELSSSESQQLEAIIKRDTELQRLFQEMESDFEKMAQENAIAPPSELKDQLMSRLKKKETPVISLDEKNRSMKQYLAIAATIALLFGITTIWLYNQINTMQDKIEMVEAENSVLKNNFEEFEDNYDEVITWYNQINDPNTIQLVLNGNEKSPTAKAISYVNHSTKMVVVNAAGLPPLDNDHDYQLWADVEGEMIDMGVIPKDTEMVAMQYIDKAESFNITIEQAGGNDHPTVEQLISNVYLK